MLGKGERSRVGVVAVPNRPLAEMVAYLGLRAGSRPIRTEVPAALNLYKRVDAEVSPTWHCSVSATVAT